MSTRVEEAPPGDRHALQRSLAGEGEGNARDSGQAALEDTGIAVSNPTFARTDFEPR